MTASRPGVPRARFSARSRRSAGASSSEGPGASTWKTPPSLPRMVWRVTRVARMADAPTACRPVREGRDHAPGLAGEPRGRVAQWPPAAAAASSASIPALTPSTSRRQPVAEGHRHAQGLGLVAGMAFPAARRLRREQRVGDEGHERDRERARSGQAGPRQVRGDEGGQDRGVDGDRPVLGERDGQRERVGIRGLEGERDEGDDGQGGTEEEHDEGRRGLGRGRRRRERPSSENGRGPERTRRHSPIATDIEV